MNASTDVADLVAVQVGRTRDDSVKCLKRWPVDRADEKNVKTSYLTIAKFRTFVPFLGRFASNKSFVAMPSPSSCRIF